MAIHATKPFQTAIFIALLGFVVSCSNTDPTPTKGIDYSAFNGNYLHESYSKDFKEFVAAIKLEFLGQNKIEFLMIIVEEGMRGGELKGVAMVKEDSIAYYNGRNCEYLKFFLEKDKVTISEMECDSWNNAQMPFEGLYLKQKSVSELLFDRF